MQATLITRRAPAARPAPRQIPRRPKNARRLASVEWEFSRAEIALMELGELLHQVAPDAPACGPAALALRMVRAEMKRIRELVGEDVAEALEGTRHDGR